MLESLLIKLQALRSATLLKRDFNTGVFLWNCRGFFWRASFAEHLQWLWFLQQNNVIFSVISLTWGYNQKLLWKYCNYYHPSLYNVSLPSIYNFNISIFLTGDGVSHSNTVHLIVSPSKTDCPSTNRRNSPLSKKCSWNYSFVLNYSLKF